MRSRPEPIRRTTVTLSRTLPVCTPILVALAGTIAAAPARAADDKTASGHAQILVQSTASWNGKPYAHYPTAQPQLTVLKLTIAPHTALPWHTHPFPNAGYVLKGALTIHDKASGKSQTFQAGQAFTESVDDVHRGSAGDEETVVILTYAGTPGVKTSNPVKGGQSEY